MVSRGWGNGCSEAKSPALPFRAHPGAQAEQLGRLGTARGCCWHAEHGASIGMLLFAYLNSALRLEATETHLTRGGRTAEESQGGGGEVSREVPEARADPLFPPHAPLTHRDPIAAVNQQRKGAWGCRPTSLHPFYLIASHPPQIPAHQSPGVSVSMHIAGEGNGNLL